MSDDAKHTVNFATDTRAHMVRLLRAAMVQYSDNPLTTWRWWSGFIWGAVVIAAMDFGDVWFCVGACNGN